MVCFGWESCKSGYDYNKLNALAPSLADENVVYNGHLN
jgi:hypothetical protein